MKKKYSVITIWLFSLLVITSIFYAYVPDLITKIYNNQAQNWVYSIINQVYPRFEVEKQRFDVAFFLQKANQVIIRFFLVNVFLIVAVWLSQNNSFFRNKSHELLLEKINVKNIIFLRIVFFTGMIYYTSDWWIDLPNLNLLSDFYKPISFLKWFKIPLLSNPIFYFLLVILYVSCLVSIFKFWKIIGVIAVSLFVFLQAFLYSFEKIDHTFASFTYVSILFPFLLADYEKQKTKINEISINFELKSQRDNCLIVSPYLKLIQFSIAWCYVQAGIEKMLISGFSWFKPETLQYHLHLHPTSVGLWLASHTLFCGILQFGTIAFQLGFMFAVFYPKIRWIFILFGILFHFGTFWLMEIGGWLTPWIFVYIFFINWEKILLFFENNMFLEPKSHFGRFIANQLMLKRNK